VIGGRRMYLWRAVDSEGEVPDLLVQPRRDTAAAVKLMRRLMKKQGFAPRVLVTDKLRSYSSAKERIGLSAIPEQGLEQPGGELPPAGATARGQAPAVQITRFSPALPLQPRRRPTTHAMFNAT
jgi:hypothetical protein